VILYLKGHMEDMIYLLGSKEEILKSIRQKLLVYPDDTVIYPGHGEPGLIGEEREAYK